MSTNQQPLGSGFSCTSTASDVIQDVDLHGKVAIVTGGSSGLGLETVRAFVSAGARVIAGVRDVGRASSDCESLPGLEFWRLDLADPASVSEFSAKFNAEGAPLHILVNNAGVMAPPVLERTQSGRELQFGVNHLGHFQLVLQLWPALVRSDGARIVSVSSVAHHFGGVIFDDVDFADQPYNPQTSYGQSKTANSLFAVELDRRGRAYGIRAFAVHPGGAAGTKLMRNLPPQILAAAGFVDSEGKPVIAPELGLKSNQQAAATQVWCAASPQLDGLGGLYCEDVDLAVDWSADLPPVPPRGVMPYAIDKDAARRLWALSEELTGMTIPV